MKFGAGLLSLLLMLSIPSAIYADENIYKVVDSTTDEELEEFSDYRSAIRFYNQYKDEYGNLTLFFNDLVIETEYAVVYFNNEEIEIETGVVVDGSYGNDATYLYSEYDEVYYMISGAIGHSDNSLLTIVPVNEYPENVSVYSVSEGVLYHNIISPNYTGYYAYSIELDDAPSYLQEGESYYSSDGHYFYDNYHEMVDDYLTGEYSHAVNESPYFNYYLYTSFRDESNITYEMLNSYFEDVLLMDSKLDGYRDFNNDGANDYLNKSQLYEELDAFFVSENIYGINAMTLVSMSIEESSYGKNKTSFFENNLFLNAAFSTSEKENGRYRTLENSIYSFAKYYLVQKYSNPTRKNYSGSFLGNKASGINVTYSDDPYYGEKVASVYYRIDRALGYPDKDSECYALISGDYVLYKDEDFSSKYARVEDGKYCSYVVLEEKEDSYKVQLDKCLDSDYRYDWMNNVAYISKDNVLLLNKEKLSIKEYKEYSFDLDGGTIGSNKILQFYSTKDIVEPKPYKEGYEFTGYQDFKAEYREIESISLVKGFTETIGSKEELSLKDAEIRVNYKDGSHSYLDVTSEMIEKITDETITVSYNGVSIETPLNRADQSVSEAETEEAVQRVLKAQEKEEDADEKDLEIIKENISDIDLSLKEIRLLDEAVYEANDHYPVFYIEDNDYDLSFSGLALAFDLNKEKGKLQLYEDTYYVTSGSVSNRNKRILDRIAEAYGFSDAGTLCLGFRYNLNKVELNSPIIVEAKLPDKRNDCIYTVYHIDENGDILKCYTTQSDSYIQFVAEESGDYIFLYKKSANTYRIADSKENISSFNNGIDSFHDMLQIMIFMVMVLYCFISYIIYCRLCNVNEKTWNMYYRLLKYMEH